MKNFLFPYNNYDTRTSILLLAVRLVVGIMFITNGIEKIENFKTLSDTFPNLIGLGSELSLILSIFAEFVCTLGFITGFLYRLSLIAIIFNMFVATFLYAPHSSFHHRELAMLYFVVFIFMFFAKAGRYSLDFLFFQKKR